jgi:glycosyltransferase involved in cell wall biosynthesis
MKTSVVIITRNRAESLRRTIESTVSQSTLDEVIVIDDASTDETYEMISSEYPEVRLYRSIEPRGCVVQRNWAAKIALGDIIVSIDDDAEFSSPRVIEQVVSEFCNHRIGAIAIPYTEPNKGNVVFQKAPDTNDVWVTDSFRGTAYALNRSLFLELGGYREHLIHQGEELDLCIRMLQAGRVTRLGRSDLIYHYESQTRDTRRIDYYGRRNDILFVGHNVPLHVLPTHLAATTLNGFRTTLRAVYPGQMLLGTLAGYGGLFGYWNQRRPVSVQTYRLHRRLKTKGPLRLRDIDRMLPSPKCAVKNH